MSERNYFLLLSDIIDAIVKIEVYTTRMDYEQFVLNEMVQDAVYRNFEVIGEAAGKLSIEFQQTNPQINWRILKNFRNVLIHRYFEVDTDIVWNAIEFELKDIKTGIQSLIDNEL